MKSSIDSKQDGINHINIYSKGKTELGRLLTNFARTPIETPFGHFESGEGYWFWLRASKLSNRCPLKNMWGFRS
jgi:hypothetical protein